MNSSARNSPTVPPSAGSRDLAGWLLIGAIGVGFLFLAAVYAPQRVKLPLISPLVLGAVAGWGLGALAGGRKALPAVFVIAASVCLIAAGEFGRTVETYRRELPALRRQIEINLQHHDIADRLDETLLEPDAVAQTPEGAGLSLDRSAVERAARLRADERAQLERLATFAGYLEHRIPPQWGRWPAPWPEIFWGAEILLASTLGAFIATRNLRCSVRASGGRQPPEAEEKISTSEDSASEDRTAG
jgi:hypothetical protein